jgi:hypothetical protein
LLLQFPDGIIGIEIKSRERVAASDSTAMKQVAQGLTDEWKGGLIVYRGDHISKIAEPNIWAVPSYRLFG